MDLDYFHGNISRLESESLLKPSFGTGTFLVRTSQQFPGDYVLSLLHAPTRGKPEYMHFQIKSQGECWFSVDDGPLFEGIDACITHYRFIPDGLPCVLFSSISRPRIRTREQENVGNTPMHTAAAQGKVEALRSNPSDVRKASKINRLPIHEACRFGHDKFVDGLLLLKSSYAFDINMPDEDGWTPMHFAAFSGNPSILRRLMSSGAKLVAKTKDGETPRDIAARLGNTDACKMLGDAEQGVVAEVDIDRESLPYMHGRVGRKVAEYILRKNLMKDGNFIVRQSQGDYVLSLSFNNQFFHFQIKANNAARTCFSIDDGPTFQGIPRVLDYYRTKADGLPCVLTTYCVRGGYSKGGKTFAAAGVAASANDIAPAVDKLQLKFDTGIYATYAAPMDRSAAMAKGSAGGAAAINREDVILGDKIGEGEFGAVYKGEWREPRGPKHQVAVKTLHPNAELENPDSQLCQDFLREAEVMSQLQHPNVVRLLGVVRYTQPLMIVQELVPLGSLQDYLESNKGKLGKKTMTLFGYQIALGMSFLEEKKFVHRDLASRNILVATPALVKISDFGFSRAIGSDDNYYKASQGGKWPMKWYAPECLYYFRFSHKSDVWSFGVTLWEIFTYAEMPYGDQSGREVLDQLTQGIRLPQPDDCPKDVYKVMLSCWEFEQEKRPDFRTLKDQLQKLC